ncbi:MAG: hypothetical protein ACXWG9_02120 [Usitatibacter sp.]
MKTTLITSFAAAALALTAPAGAAEQQDHDGVVILHQHLAAADSAHEQADAWKRWADDFSHELRASMGTMFSGRVGSSKVVKGAPYSAEVVTEANQALADGNVISHTSRGAIYRDAEGRTRQETAGDGKARSIFINDPVEGKHWVLTPNSKRAIEMPRLGSSETRLMRFGSTEVRVEDGKVFVDGKEAPGGKAQIKAGGKDIRVDGGKVYIDGKEVGTGDSMSHVIVKTIEGKDSPDGLKREEVRVQIVRTGDGKDITLPHPPMPPLPSGELGVPMPPLPPIPPMAGLHTMRFESTARLGKGLTTSLGTKDFDGVKAEGKSTVWTIPAGEIGNRNAINVSSESWYSPELQVTVYSRYNDPRAGESIYRLAGIKRGEPAPELFRVPEDYKVKSHGAK